MPLSRKSKILPIFLIQMFTPWMRFLESIYRCLGSARFWLPGSGSAKICGSTVPPRGKISTKMCKKNLHFKTQISTSEKNEIIKMSSFLNGSSSYRIRISEKNKTKYLKITFCLKSSVNHKEMTWIRIHYFPVRI